MANLAMDFDDPLNFDSDDPPLVTSKKRKKVIGLDDLFKDHKKEQEKEKKGKLKFVKGPNVCESDDDDDANNDTENRLNEALHGFKKTICEVDGHDGALNDLGKEDVTLGWGVQVFGTQKTRSLLAVPQLEDCMLLQTSLSNEGNVLLDNSSEMGETLLKGLLVNGWLSKLIITYGVLEESIAKWTLNLLFYTTEEPLMASACDFWCAILCSKVDAPAIKIEWLPGFLELKSALDFFGFQLHPSTNVLPPVESTLDGN
ncbi:Rab3 GTPase-activating protein non-catalytic subunit [Bienertia sinuspersici]